MLDIQDLKKQFNNIDFREKRPGLFKVLLPFYHEDGDMFDIFIEESLIENNLIRISDYGLTLMKLSYAFELDTDNKNNILESIIRQNRCQFDDGNIYLDVTIRQFEGGIYQFAQVISKVTNIDILSKEVTKSNFYDQFNEFVLSTFSDYHIKSDIAPLEDKDLKVDFEIPSKRPIYLFGVKDDSKASKVVISCLNFNMYKLPYRSLIVCENNDSLSNFSRNQLTNTADKQFTNLKSFKEKGVEYITRELQYA